MQPGSVFLPEPDPAAQVCYAIFQPYLLSDLLRYLLTCPLPTYLVQNV